jgi:hypothetical protein
MPIVSEYGHWTLPVTVQAGAYTVQTRDFGSLILANGAATFTLPPPGPHIAGVWVQFGSIAAGDMVISGTANTMVVDNDATATDITFGTAGEEIGSHVEAVCDGTGWLIFNHLSDTDASKATS